MVELFSFTFLSSQSLYPLEALVFPVVLRLNASVTFTFPAFAILFLNSSYHAMIRSFENRFIKSENEPSSVAFCPKLRGGTIIRLGGVRSLLVISSVWRATQSMINSGNPEIRRFFTLMIFPSENGLLESILISIAVPSLCPSQRERSGPQRFIPRPPRLESPELIFVSLVLLGVLRYVIISCMRLSF